VKPENTDTTSEKQKSWILGLKELSTYFPLTLSEGQDPTSLSFVLKGLTKKSIYIWADLHLETTFKLEGC